MKRELVKVAGAFTIVEYLHAEPDEPLKSKTLSLPPNRSLFKEYPNRVGIDIGSYRGDSIQAFLDAGFEEVRSIDISREQYLFCCDRFNLYDKNEPLQKMIKLYEGDSSKMLWDMIADINEPMSFWLDAHSQLLEDEEYFHGMDFPLLEELKQISRHPIKCHHILIDDILVLTHPDITGWSRKTIEDAVMAINPAYQFQYVANPVKNNLLICTI